MFFFQVPVFMAMFVKKDEENKISYSHLFSFYWKKKNVIQYL